MAASFTCHRHLPLGGVYCSRTGDNHNNTKNNNNNNSSHLLHLVQSTLASTPLCSDSGQVPSSSLLLAPPLPSLALSSRTISHAVNPISSSRSCNTLELNRTVMDAGGDPSVLDRACMPFSMETHVIDTTRTSTPTLPSFSPAQIRTPKRKRTVSPPSPSTNSPGQLRSASRSTRHSTPNSRGSSLHSHRRTATTTSLTPSLPDSPVRRENLLALHRESCRLFQDQETTRPSTQTRRSPSPISPRSPPRSLRTSSTLNSPPLSPILVSRPSISIQELDRSRHSYSYDRRIDSIPSIHPAPTVIDWTSPSTRRREYQEIDRASSGVRGLWRRVAPKWCQFGDSRMPFFEEDKDGKGNYEGSVRRFRMDIPDEPGPKTSLSGLKLKKKLVIHTMGSRRKTRTS